MSFTEIIQTCVLLSAAKPVDALASRKSPLSTAILLPKLKSSICEFVNVELESSTRDNMLTMPLWISPAVWIISTISANDRWLQHSSRRQHYWRRVHYHTSKSCQSAINTVQLSGKTDNHRPVTDHGRILHITTVLHLAGWLPHAQESQLSQRNCVIVLDRQSHPHGRLL